MLRLCDSNHILKLIRFNCPVGIVLQISNGFYAHLWSNFKYSGGCPGVAAITFGWL
jgi:hypothetical protein